ncbi:LmbE family N-acetylglucosaminyl deacetylase [Bradyrhizobium japonicum USDA 38]|uniref:PIG-L deacetylase family protein n=1 Tax=Bradyrhizobium japonicum TaxID=375 RepID=UPI000488B741|nr:PIG-L deacetylase family protein [Bradyrhizobium japonicum]MCS3893386.1 LmbE family N-acetylglucosaminyl deacetylase [Bradyrhizobium japonicum USDA 38]MCS3945900.1 LmbE family N-acetylglucosaminyl deacetylase [Bradyrhizobium japonicum]
MNAEDYFHRVKGLPITGWRELTRGEPFAVLSPHPDDESLGAGGLIAQARHHAQNLSIILLTDGSQSHPNSKTYPRDRLIATRRSELAEAAGILGVPLNRLFELGLHDTAAPSEGPDFEHSVDRVSTILASIDARTLFVTWEHDPHCDHQAAARLAQKLRRRDPALTLWSYPVWGWHLSPSHMVSAPAPKGFRLAIEDVLPQKRAAIAAHTSQMTDLIDDDPDGFRFTNETLEPFLRPFEYYIEVPLR